MLLPLRSLPLFPSTISSSVVSILRLDTRLLWSLCLSIQNTPKPERTSVYLAMHAHVTLVYPRMACQREVFPQGARTNHIRKLNKWTAWTRRNPFFLPRLRIEPRTLDIVILQWPLYHQLALANVLLFEDTFKSVFQAHAYLPSTSFYVNAIVR